VTRLRILVVLAITTAASAAATASQAQSHAQHLDARAQHVMGFDQQKTAHHFLLFEDGGAVDVSVKDASDAVNRDAIRAHLPHLAKLFGAGDFEAPMLVHDRKDIPGVRDLARFKDRISYRYTETPRGGRVDIVTTDKDALAAVHAFLKFQIEDHKTGDALAVKRRKPYSVFQ
jgi:hypothetical protein